MILLIRGTAPDPHPNECLSCYLDRALPIAGCDAQTQPLTAHWIAAKAEPLLWLERWLKIRGGYCDCEVGMNGLNGDPITLRGLVLSRATGLRKPYLLQHKQNPVDWCEWGPEAFAEAERRHVPILLSIGYAACHWCHVISYV